MSLRQITLTDGAPLSRVYEFRRAVISDTSIIAIWAKINTDGTREQRQVEVSAALYNNLSGRAAFQAMLDNIRDDTSNAATAT